MFRFDRGFLLHVCLPLFAVSSLFVIPGGRSQATDQNVDPRSLIDTHSPSASTNVALPPTTSKLRSDKLVNFPLIRQKTNLWCWAACTEMVVRVLNPSFANRAAQCEQARMAFGAVDACTMPTPLSAINGGWPQFEHFGICAKVTDDQAIGWDEICHQITDKKSPIIFSWHWINAYNQREGGHVMVLIGYSVDDSGKEMVTIYDPLKTQSQDITYATYVGNGTAGNGSDDLSGYGPHTHWNDYYDLAGH